MPAPDARPLLLASTSAHRRMLLDRLGLAYAVRAPEVDEALREGELPAARAVRLAIDKARAVAAQMPGALVIGSDQVASIAESGLPAVLRKPGTRERCLAQLARLSGNTASFDTAVCLADSAGLLLVHADHTQVRFRTLDVTEIEAYVDREPSFDCAGGFKCEGLGVSLFESVATEDPTALVGLPLIGVCRLLREAGVRV